MRISRLLILAVCCCTLVTYGRDAGKQESKQQESAQQEQARKFWNRIIDAKGGRENLHAVSSVLIGFKVRKNYRVALYSFPDKSWEWFADIADEDRFVQLFNGRLGISKYIKQDGTELPSEGSLRPLIVEPIPYLLETQLAQPTPVSVSRRHFGKSLLDVVRTRFRDDEIEFVVDPNSLMVVIEIFWSKKYHNAAEPWRIMCFYDYAQIDGIMLPQKFDVRDVPEGRNIFNIEKYRKHPITLRVNVQYRDKLFESPPPVSEGPEAWKPKQP